METENLPPVLSLDDPEHAAVRGELARLFIQHKAQLGLPPHVSDEAEIAAQTDDIFWVMWSKMVAAIKSGQRERFAEKFGWFVEAVGRLIEDQPAVKMDG